jgi:hypothetical protein
MKYNICDLEYLKKIFYEFEELKCVDPQQLNKSLNLFYGFEARDNDLWRTGFKDAIRKKGANSNEKGKKYVGINAEEFKNICATDIMKMAFEKKRDIKCKLSKLYKSQAFNKTVIYEAPPYLLLLKELDGPENIEFIAEFILDDKCSSPYSNAIRGCFQDQNSSIEEILKKNSCGFFDVIPMPLPINSDLRNNWATDDKFVIDGKRIFVHFFEWAIENYKKIVGFSNEQKHKIAIGIPLNNAITLYEKYEGEILKFGCHENQNILFNEPHSIKLANKKVGLWIHPFKNCVISTSNTPNSELMKLAFEK